jgi:hypothetical protein
MMSSFTKYFAAQFFDEPIFKTRTTISKGDVFCCAFADDSNQSLYVAKDVKQVNTGGIGYGDSYEVMVCEKLQLVGTGENVQMLQGFTGENGVGPKLTVIGRLQ